MSFSREAIKTFWDKKAIRYPSPLDHKVAEKTAEVLRRLKTEGICFSKKRVLDIGCGNGAYTLAVAKEASYVCGLDCSESMLSELLKLADSMQITNIGVMNRFWEDIDPERENLKGDFDIVMAMMTPAIRTESDILKMEECAREWLIFMGWVKRKNPLLQRILLLHGIDLVSDSPFYSTLFILEKKRRRPHFQFFEMNFEYKGSIDEVTQDFCDYVELYGRKPRKNGIEMELRSYEEDGIVKYKIEAEVGTIFWKPKDREGS